MLDFEDCDGVSETTLPNRSNLAEGSEHFRSVMKDFLQEHQSSKSNSRDSDKINSDIKAMSDLCTSCLGMTFACKCRTRRTDKRVINRVQWADETCDGPLTKEHKISTGSSLLCSPRLEETNNIKPILKHKTNCIIVLAE